jgi:hypothetical protein
MHVKLVVGVSELTVIETIRGEESIHKGLVTANILMKRLPFSFRAPRKGLRLDT